MRLLGLCGVLLLGTSLVKGLNIVNTFEAEGSFDTVSKGEDDALLRKRLPPSATAAPIAVAGTPIQDQSKSIKKEFLQRFKGRWWSKIDKKPKTKYKKMKKPEGFNKKKDSITLARLGTGNPYQRYRYFQVSDTRKCIDKPCELKAADIRMLMHYWRLEGPKPKHAGGEKWTNGSFAVDDHRWSPVGVRDRERAFAHNTNWEIQKLDFSGLDETVPTCKGEAGEVICVHWRAAYTTYKVAEFHHKKTEAPTKGQAINGTERYISSPNSGGPGAGKGMICAKESQCTKYKDHKWGKKVAQGGPQKYPFDKDFM